MTRGDLMFEDGDQVVVDAFVEVADLFVESLDPDGLLTILLRCSDLARVADGAILLVDQRGNLEVAVASRQSVADMMRRQVVAGGGLFEVCRDSGLSMSNSFDPANGSFDDYCRDAINAGFQHEYHFPLRHQGRIVGVLVLMDTHELAIDSSRAAVAQGVADVAASIIEHARVLENSRTLSLQLQKALDSRVLIEQAKGILAERNGVDITDAFKCLRQAARNSQRPILAVAQEIVQGLKGQDLGLASGALPSAQAS